MLMCFTLCVSHYYSNIPQTIKMINDSKNFLQDYESMHIIQVLGF